MAIRKPRRESGSNAAAAADVGRWPYPIQERRIRVQSDGTVRIPATFARLFALEGEYVTITLYADGHVEMDGPDGRALHPPPHDPGGRVYLNDQEFLAALNNDFRDE